MTYSNKQKRVANGISRHILFYFKVTFHTPNICMSNTEKDSDWLCLYQKITPRPITLYFKGINDDWPDLNHFSILVASGMESIIRRKWLEGRYNGHPRIVTMVFHDNKIFRTWWIRIKQKGHMPYKLKDMLCLKRQKILF